MTDAESATTADDAALVSRAARGDVQAFELLYARSAGRVYAVCLRMTGDRQRARELAHDAFVRAWERLASFRGESAFDTWIHRLAVNVVLTSLRAQRRRESRVSLAGDDADEAAVASSAVAPSDIGARIDLERAIASLPSRAREIFVLHDVEGFRHDEIAERMDLPPGTVRSHLHRARQLLMRMLT